jgi:hypothetical protein
MVAFYFLVIGEAYTMMCLQWCNCCSVLSKKILWQIQITGMH